MRTWASAWRTRAIAAAMSKFCARACSIRADSSGERKPRHQSSDGQASAAVASVARNATGISTCRAHVVGTEVAAAAAAGQAAARHESLADTIADRGAIAAVVTSGLSSGTPDAAVQ